MTHLTLPRPKILSLPHSVRQSLSASKVQHLEAFHQIQVSAYLNRLAAMDLPPCRVQERAEEIQYSAQARHISDALYEELKNAPSALVHAIEKMGAGLQISTHDEKSTFDAKRYLVRQAASFGASAEDGYVSSSEVVTTLARYIHRAWRKSCQVQNAGLKTSTISHNTTGNLTPGAEEFSEPLYQDRVGAIFLALELAKANFFKKLSLTSSVGSLSGNDALILPDPPAALPPIMPSEYKIPSPLAACTSPHKSEHFERTLAAECIRSLLEIIPAVALQPKTSWKDFLVALNDIPDRLRGALFARQLEKNSSANAGYHYTGHISGHLKGHLNLPANTEKAAQHLKRLFDAIAIIKEKFGNLDYAAPFELRHYQSPEAVSAIREQLLSIVADNARCCSGAPFSKEGASLPDFFSKYVEIIAAQNPSTNEIYAFSVVFKLSEKANSSPASSPQTAYIQNKKHSTLCGQEVSELAYFSVYLATQAKKIISNNNSAMSETLEKNEIASPMVEPKDQPLVSNAPPNALMMSHQRKTLETLFQTAYAVSNSSIEEWNTLLHSAHRLSALYKGNVQSLNDDASRLYESIAKEMSIIGARFPLRTRAPAFVLRCYNNRDEVELVKDNLIAISSGFARAPTISTMNSRGGVRFNFVTPELFKDRGDDLEIVAAHDAVTNEVCSFSIVYKPTAPESMGWGIKYKATNPVFFGLYGKNDRASKKVELSQKGDQPSLLLSVLLATELNLVLSYGCEAHIGVVWGDNWPSQKVLLNRLKLTVDLTGATNCPVVGDTYFPLVRDMSRASLAADAEKWLKRRTRV